MQEHERVTVFNKPSMAWKSFNFSGMRFLDIYKHSSWDKEAFYSHPNPRLNFMNDVLKVPRSLRTYNSQLNSSTKNLVNMTVISVRKKRK